jgi:hypothetical protein
MANLLPLLALACPVGMAAMMIWMHRRGKGGGDE